MLRSALIAGALSGALYGLSLPKADVGPLAWFCLVPMLASLVRPGLDGKPIWSRREALWCGLSSGIIAGGFRVYWIAETLGLYGGLGIIEAVSTTCLLILYIALYPMLFVGICHRAICHTRGNRAFILPWLVAATWSLFDWVQTWMISGFPWALLGTSQYDQPWVASLAALLGTNGITFFIVAVNTAIAQVVLGQQRNQRRSGALCLLVSMLLIVSWSAYHRQALTVDQPTGDALRIGIVQGNVGQDIKWNSGWKQATMQHYVSLTQKLKEDTGDLDLILWPETALPFRFDDDAHSTYRTAIAELAQELTTPLLIGSLGTSRADGQPGLYNRSFLFDEQGQLVATGDKVHLVPFGEYLPLAWLFGYMRQLTAQSGAFDPGQEHSVLPLASQRLGLFVCYESIFPTITRELVQKGAGVLINTTNDAWFGTTAAPYQHFAMVVMRAIETGRPVVRAANTGISGAIDADGRNLRATTLGSTDALVVQVKPRQSITPYARFGDIIFLLSAAIWVGFLFVVRTK